MILLKNGRVITMAGTEYSHGDVLIESGKIKAVGEGVEAPPNAEQIDCTGKTVVPGLIDAHCHIGLSEDGNMYEGEDNNEAVNPVTPSLRSVDGINPEDMAIRDARLGGVTTVCVSPGNLNVYGGMMSVIKTCGIRVDDMVLKEEAAIKAALGEGPKTNYAPLKVMPMTRMGIAALMRENLLKAREYMKKQASGSRSPMDFTCEALAKILRRELPLAVHANRMDDIYTALRIAKEFDFKLVLVQASEAYRMTEAIKAANVPVILGAALTGRPSIETAGMSHRAPVYLAEAGIDFCISTDAPPVPVPFLAASAGCAVREGLSPEAALRAITITPAKVLGIAERVGSLEPGKDADIVVYDGKVFDLTTKTSLVMINGKIITN